eukprot:GGOE01009130.1.p3 GENE.GGOE01009130.1~~GGOE01009130.1.p3  ORF type:complete len:124 (+),score=3.87 GGOE01009130.1:258-629(+)
MNYKELEAAEECLWHSQESPFLVEVNPTNQDKGNSFTCKARHQIQGKTQASIWRMTEEAKQCVGIASGLWKYKTFSVKRFEVCGGDDGWTANDVFWSRSSNTRHQQARPADGVLGEGGRRGGV